MVKVFDRINRGWQRFRCSCTGSTETCNCPGLCCSCFCGLDCQCPVCVMAPENVRCDSCPCCTYRGYTGQCQLRKGASVPEVTNAAEAVWMADE